MTTEKRLYKPKPIPEVRFILEFLIPLFGGFDIQKKFKEHFGQGNFFNQLQKAYNQSLTVLFGNHPIEKITSWRASPEVERELPTILANAQDMIRACVWQDKIKMKNFSEWANSSVQPLMTLVGQGKNGYIFVNIALGQYSPGEQVRLFRATIARHIAKAFQDNERRAKINGIVYIGACPRCNKIFKKTRSDKEFCSKQCADVMLKRRERGSSKSD